MRILLVMPDMKGVTGIRLPLGLGYLYTVIKKAGYEIKVVDLSISYSPLRDYLMTLEGFKPQLVGFSCTTPAICRAWELCKLAKKKNCFTVLGGPHPTSLPEESLKKAEVDFVIRGEGEETFLELLEVIKKGGDFSSIKGLSFKNDKGIINNQPNEPRLNLDELPFPDWRSFKINKYWSAIYKAKRLIPILTTRGCPYKCVFCYKGVFGYRVRKRSVESIVEEFVYLKKEFSPNIVEVQDDIFNIDLDRVSSICEELLKKNIKLNWSCPNGIRADRVEKRLLLMMKKAGCVLVAFGIESGSQEILDRMEKGQTLLQARKAIELANEAGLRVMPSYLFGFPGETKQTMQQTIDFSIQLNTDYAQFFIPTPYPGTKLRELVEKNGKLLIKDWRLYGQGQGKVYFEFGKLTAPVIRKMYGRAHRSFFLRPSYLWRRLSRLSSLDEFIFSLKIFFRHLVNFVRK